MTDMFHPGDQNDREKPKDAVNGDMKAREEMANAQYIAGMAFPTWVLAWCTGWRIRWGRFYDTPHGVANAVLLPYVMEHNQDATGEKIPRNRPGDGRCECG